MKLWITCDSFCMFPGHAVLSLPRFRGDISHYYCVNAGIYNALTYTETTA